MTGGSSSEPKRVSIKVEGLVQDVGFRDHVESLGRDHGLKGYVLNNGEGVGIVAEGDQQDLDNFIEEVHRADEETLADISNLTTKEIPRKFSIPGQFQKLSTEDLGDIGRKLDKGVNYISSLNERQKKMAETQEKIAENLSSLNKRQDDMITLLGDIETHLDERL